MNKKQKNKSRGAGMTARIRAAAGRLNQIGSFSRSDVFNQAEVLVSERATFSPCWLDMRTRGELVKLGYQEYRYDESRAPNGGGVKKKIYRAMHVKGAFCAPDIAKLAEAEISYVHGVIRRLVKGGELEFTGCRGHFKYFRVRNSDKFYQKFIRGRGSEVKGQRSEVRGRKE